MRLVPSGVSQRTDAGGDFDYDPVFDDATLSELVQAGRTKYEAMHSLRVRRRDE